MFKDKLTEKKEEEKFRHNYVGTVRFSEGGKVMFQFELPKQINHYTKKDKKAMLDGVEGIVKDFLKLNK